ncbi:MAG: DUF4349 domain-containing protein [Eubacteriales bacterium]
MKKSKILLFLLSIILVLSFAACGNYSEETPNYDTDGITEYGSNTITQDSSASNEDESKSTILENVVNSETNRKIIYSYSLTMRTKEYDSNMSSIKSMINQYGGYIENASETGSKPEDLSDPGRYIYMTIRVPVDKSQEFVDNVSELAEVTANSTAGSDVTQSYMDVETRIENISARIDSLQALLKKATSIEDIITIDKELNDATIELESYTSVKEQYDNLIEYATINISLEEINTSTTALDESDLSFWQKVAAGFNSVVSGLWFFIKNVLIFLLSASPVLIILAGIALAIIIPMKKRKKDKTAKLDEPKSDNKKDN